MGIVLDASVTSSSSCDDKSSQRRSLGTDLKGLRDQGARGRSGDTLDVFKHWGRSAQEIVFAGLLLQGETSVLLP